MEPSIRLYELNEFLRRSIALNFPALLWVRCEIAQLSESRGHFYLTLVEKEEEGTEDIIAQSNGILWQRDYRRLRRKIGVRLEKILQEGMEVLVQVKVEFHERYGLSLSIQDLEGDYTLGKIASRRQERVAHLNKLGLLEKNKSIELPVVLQRLAVISAATAAGYQDYLQHLKENTYAYSFISRLFPAAMQGINASGEIRRQLKEIAERADDFDAVLILRGGGAKLDLMAFDDLEMALAVAKHPLPVLVGIGHEVDETVLDLVAHQSLKTPTAVADFVLHHNTLFESEILQLGQAIQTWGKQHLVLEATKINQEEQLLHLQSKNRLREEKRFLDFWESNWATGLQRRIASEKQTLENMAQNIQLLSPEECLRRGYSITLHKGKAISNKTTLPEGAILETRLQNGSIISKVVKES